MSRFRPAASSCDKSPGGENRVNVRGRRAMHVLCGLPVRVTVWHVHDPLHFGMPSMRPKQVHRASLISPDNQERLGRRKIYTLRTLYIFNSLALMSLALVALNRRRRDLHIVSEFSILISAKFFDRFRSRFLGINWEWQGWIYGPCSTLWPYRYLKSSAGTDRYGIFFGWRRTLSEARDISYLPYILFIPAVGDFLSC